MINSDITKQEIQRLLRINKIDKASTVCDKLCNTNPDDIEIWLLSASIHAQLGNLTRVIECCKKVITLQPDHLMAHYNLGLAFQFMGDLPAAERTFLATLRLNPDMHKARSALGYVVLQLGRAEEAVNIYGYLLNKSIQNDATTVLNANINLSLALMGTKRFTDAEQACNRALAIAPDSAHALNNLGQTLKEQGKLESAAIAHKKAVEAQPDFIVAHSNYLLDLNYLTHVDDKKIFYEHCLWERQHTLNLSTKQHSNTRHTSTKRLRVGYVSPDFRAHSVILFIAGLIEAHNRDDIETFCYSDVKSPDAYTRKIHKISDHWREISNMDNGQLSTVIEKDKIDILVDLAGHTSNNRLLAFAQKPAPIQATWLGYPNTTGLTSMDYRLTDKWADPMGISDKLCTETLVRLPNGFLCFQPLADSPPVSELPMLENGYITFGSLNNSAKINSDVIKLWIRLLKELPESRLILKSPQLSDASLKQRYLTKFESTGIDPSRIDIYGRIPSTIEHLSIYRNIDLALDPFPYNGTTTTCEALWMGVPVVSLEGHNHAGRVGVSLLTTTGLTEFLAKTDDDYVRICTGLAKDPDRLSKLRKNMRERLQETPLLDTKSFAKDIENAYQDMWLSFCNQQ